MQATTVIDVPARYYARAAEVLLREGIVEDADLIDAGCIFGSGFAPFRGGPLTYARSRGVDNVVARLQELSSKYGPRFTPDPGWSLVGAGAAQRP